MLWASIFSPRLAGLHGRMSGPRAYQIVAHQLPPCTPVLPVWNLDCFHSCHLHADAIPARDSLAYSVSNELSSPPLWAGGN